jgi:hypothetical protein
MAQTLILDDFSVGDVVVTNTITGGLGDPLPDVFGERRTILLRKAVEASATSVSVGSGVLSWNQTDVDDYATVIYGDWRRWDLSAYNAFRITLDSAPEASGELEVNYFQVGGWPNQSYTFVTSVPMPATGIAVIPFSSFMSSGNLPPVDFSQAQGVGLVFNGAQLASGTYVFDNFEAFVIPEPTSPVLFCAGVVTLVWRWRLKSQELREPGRVSSWRYATESPRHLLVE